MTEGRGQGGGWLGRERTGRRGNGKEGRELTSLA